jgi:hypothetical protein
MSSVLESADGAPLYKSVSYVRKADNQVRTSDQYGYMDPEMEQAASALCRRRGAPANEQVLGQVSHVSLDCTSAAISGCCEVSCAADCA